RRPIRPPVEYADRPDAFDFLITGFRRGRFWRSWLRGGSRLRGFWWRRLRDLLGRWLGRLPHQRSHHQRAQKKRAVQKKCLHRFLVGFNVPPPLHFGTIAVLKWLRCLVV